MGLQENNLIDIQIILVKIYPQFKPIDFEVIDNQLISKKEIHNTNLFNFILEPSLFGDKFIYNIDIGNNIKEYYYDYRLEKYNEIEKLILLAKFTKNQYCEPLLNKISKK